MAIENEPRALSAALSQPAFATRAGGVAMHVADRHVERWAPEGSAGRQRPMRNLGFVDRLIAPWIETAQRSASLRLFSQYQREGVFGERAPSAVSWVFPRPWYQDELDWMAAARQAPAPTTSMFTTRGTYVAPANALPAALYDYVAPSLSVAEQRSQPAGVGYGGETMRADAYSSIVPLAAVQAAEVMSRAIDPLVRPAPAAGGATARMTPALRNLLSTMLDRASTRSPDPAEPTRLSMRAPELVTPPAPRAPEAPADAEPSATMQLAERYAEQRARLVEVQRLAQRAAERELVARDRGAEGDTRAAAIRAESELRERAVAARQAARQDSAAERARVEERVAQRIAERQAAQRLHDQARSEAAEHARTAIAATPPDAPRIAEPITEPRAPAEVAAAIAALPPDLASFIGRRPERAMQALGELNEALRTVELLARSAESGGGFESSRGPRLMMPAGLGGLVAAVDRAHTISEQPAAMTGQRPLAPLRFGEAGAAAPRIAPTRTPALSWLAAPSRPTTALDAAVSASPAALTHVAWADRWLARFAGASQQSLDTLSAAAGPSRLEALAAAAPGSVFVSPVFDTARDGDVVRFDQAGRAIVTAPGAAMPAAQAGQPGQPGEPGQPGMTRLPSPPEAIRYDDSAETPDDVFAAISAGATQVRSAAIAPPPVARIEEARTERFTAADAVAQAAPGAPGAGFAAQLASSPFAPALRHVLPLPTAASFDVRALFGGGIAATYLAGLLGASSEAIDVGARELPSWASWLDGAAEAGAPTERAVPSWDPAYVAPDAALEEVEAPLTTMRTALLSWSGGDAAQRSIDAPTIATSTSSPITSSTARAMIDSMAMPMLGDVGQAFAGIDAAGERGTAWTAPGMVASRAHAWSVAQERSSSDLSLDFVTPELVLAARVYGLGPAEAAQAARLALAGPGHLTAMAGTVDRTFVQAMAIEADRRDRAAAARETITTAYPTPSGEVIAATRPAAASTGAAFGIERKTPRGAYLWPSATVAALNLNAAAPDGQQSMSVAALELLAAQAVAEIGTFAALGDDHAHDPAIEASRGARSLRAGSPVPVDSSAAASIGASFGASIDGSFEPAEADVLGAAGALVPAARRGRFEALYVALSQSSTGRTWSPAARAARALALAGRDPDGPMSARERATTAWDVLPVVYAEAGESSLDDEPRRSTQVTASRGVAPSRRAGAPADLIAPDGWGVEMRPGLGALSARAGEALGSYVTPLEGSASAASSASSSSSSAPREVGAVLRAPTAAQELVRTGRPSGRHGGGEVEIPPWFEAAARKMLEDRSGVSDGISLAELTLVSAAPSSHVAASTRAVPSASVAPAQGTQATQANAPQIDVEKLANEIYRHILVLMDVARARNGEPYL